MTHAALAAPLPQTFFCGGRCVAGPSWTSLIGTSALILAPSGVFLGLVCPDVSRAYSWALLAFGIWLPVFSVAALLITGCSDPGIIPRIPPPEPDEFPNGRPRCGACGCATIRTRVRNTHTCGAFRFFSSEA